MQSSWGEKGSPSEDPCDPPLSALVRAGGPKSQRRTGRRVTAAQTRCPRLSLSPLPPHLLEEVASEYRSE